MDEAIPPLGRSTLSRFLPVPSLLKRVVTGGRGREEGGKEAGRAGERGGGRDDYHERTARTGIPDTATGQVTKENEIVEGSRKKGAERREEGKDGGREEKRQGGTEGGRERGREDHLAH